MSDNSTKDLLLKLKDKTFPQSAEAENEFIVNFKKFVYYIYKNTENTATPLKVVLYISFLITILSFTIALYYIFSVIIMVINTLLGGSTNNDELDTTTIKSLSLFRKEGFNLTKVLRILPIISILLIIVFFILKIFIKTIDSDGTAGIVQLFACVIGFSAIFAVIMQYLVYKYVGQNIVVVNERLDIFNNFVCVNLYKNIAFLSKIERPQISIVGVNMIIRDCLKMVYLKETSETDLTKAFYTLTLFNHYQQLSLRSKTIYNSFKIFKYTELLSNRCSPATYLSASGTYIEDISNTLIIPNLPSKVNNIFLERALTRCNELLIKTNELANTLYPQDAFFSFTLVSVLTMIINAVPLIILYTISTSLD
jgi:hypothetical protein